MKVFTRSTVLCMAFLLLSCIAGAQSISMTSTVLSQPCNNNGSIGVTVTGLTPPISYTYTNWLAAQTIVHSGIGSITNSVTGLQAYQSQWTNANVWTVSASDGIHSASTSVTLTPSFIFADSLSVANCPATSTLEAFCFGGTAPYSFVWTNLNTFLSYNTNPVNVPNGFYSLAVTDAAGCMVASATATGNIYVYSNSGIIANTSGTSANCTNGTATITASGGTAPYTYLWSNSAVTQTLGGLSQGSYTCMVTDAIGCQGTGYHYVQQAVTLNFNTTITNATCQQSNGAVMGFVSGGTAPYTFLWSNGATTSSISGVTGGQQYIVQITDANGCTQTGYPYVNVNTPISVTYTTAASSCTLPTGSATLTAAGGVAPYTIQWFTYPVTSSGASIINKTSGSYPFTVTDANGCIQTGAAYIPPSSNITAVLNNSAVVCPATTGNLSVIVSGSNPPFTYAWSNGATTSAITSVTLGGYNCVITDAAGCSVTKFGSVYQNSPVHVGLSVTPAGCIYSANGSATATATGGTAPYVYSWSNAQTGTTATGLATGNYYVFVTDANGCTNDINNSHAFVGYNAANNSCYCTITGTVYVDANSNCVMNAGENGIPNVQIHCSGLGYAYTNASGVYSFMAPTGSYTLTESVQQIYPLASCQANNQVVAVTAGTNCVSTVNFANNVTILHDLHIITASMNFPVPGNVYTQKVIVQNNGTSTESGVQIGYTHDGQLTFNSCTPWALTQPNAGTFPDWYRITSGFTSLSPGASSAAFINYNVPTNIPLSTLVAFNDTVARIAPMSTSWLTDNTPWNNVSAHYVTVVGSYDPNFKEVSPKGTGPQGNIAYNDSILTYVVHFQNTGSYYAQNIVVIDSLDADLNIASLRPGYSDHDYTTSMNENGVVKFTFNNINLPWKSTYGDNLSSGMFTYSVKLKRNLAIGTQVKNKAAIYFDYNEPVITNTTLNTLASSSPLSVEQLSADADQASLFPNPANSYFTLSLTSKQALTGTLHIFDISGREVSNKSVSLQAGENAINENTTHLQSGIYFVKLETPAMQVVKKLIIAK